MGVNDLRNWPLYDVDGSWQGQLVVAPSNEETYSVWILMGLVSSQSQGKSEPRVRRSGHTRKDGSNAHPVSFFSPFSPFLPIHSVHLCTGRNMYHEKPSP
jgi:hypothetical protein